MKPRIELIGTTGYAIRIQEDKSGQLKTASVLELMRLEMDDDEWKRAMQAIKDSIQTTGTAIYVRVYERVGDSDQYQAIPLDLAAV